MGFELAMPATVFIRAPDEDENGMCGNNVTLESRSRQYLADRCAVVDVEPLAAGDFEAAGVETELLQDRGVDVRDVVSVFDGVKADLIGRAVNDPALDPTTRHPNGEAVNVMVPSV